MTKPSTVCSNKTASSQAAWALLTEGVTSARVEAHRLSHMVHRALKLIEQSEQSEHIHQVAGDIIQGVPRRLERLEIDLDRTALALSKMGESFLEARLPLDDKTRVDQAVLPAFGGGGHKYASTVAKVIDRVAVRYLLARLQED